MKDVKRRKQGERGALPRFRTGFTLVEIVVVLAVLGMLAISVLNRFEPKNLQALAEADALRAVLRYAQARAMADVYTWGVQFSSSGYTLFSNNPSQTHPVLSGQGTPTHVLASGVTLSGPGVIMFDWRGEPVSTSITTPGGSGTVVSVSQNVLLTESNASVTVTVTPYTGCVP